jgi:hypothetical protein
MKQLIVCHALFLKSKEQIHLKLQANTKETSAELLHVPLQCDFMYEEISEQM